MKDVLVYLSGPITPRNDFSLENNIASATKVFTECIKMGIPAFCPHFCPLTDIPYETWMDYDFAVLKRCTHILMLPRWGDSPGALRERAYAIQLGIPVYETLKQLKETIKS